MHVHRLTKSAAATLFACALLSGFTFSAFAQTPDPAYSAATPQAETDPPGRVARLNYMAGTVTSEPAGASDWSYAQINRPLTTGDQLWNDEGARSELHVGSTAVRLGSSTSLEILYLDDNSAQLKVAQGTLSTRVRSLPPGGAYEIDTPNAALGVTAPGDYRVDVAPDGSRTTVTVRSGSRPRTATAASCRFPPASRSVRRHQPATGRRQRRAGSRTSINGPQAATQPKTARCRRATCRAISPAIRISTRTVRGADHPSVR